jgi:hypothetical protein
MAICFIDGVMTVVDPMKAQVAQVIPYLWRALCGAPFRRSQ